MTTSRSISLTISEEVLEQFPGMTVGGFVAQDLGSCRSSVEATARALADAQVALKPYVDDTAGMASHALIAAWREAIGRCGLKPSQVRSSVEQLARRVASGRPVQTPLPLVDLYCAISAKHLAPLGGYDLSRLPGSVVSVRYGNEGRDSFSPIGRHEESFGRLNGVVLYAADREVLCWAFNHRDSANTCLVSDTAAAIFLGEATTLEQCEALRSALNDLRGILAELGANVGEISWASSKKPSLRL